MKYPSLMALESIKHEAKTLKKSNPTLKHNQLLDLASKKIAKVRNFHEARKNCINHVNSFITYSGSFATCSYCTRRFIHEYKEEQELHLKSHLLFEEVEAFLNYLPDGYRVRESKKKEAYKDLSSKNIDMNIQGAKKLLRSWFDRSLEGAIEKGYWREHPTFEEYAAMIKFDRFSPAVAEALKAQYGEILGQIKPNQSDWHPKNSLSSNSG